MAPPPPDEDAAAAARAMDEPLSVLAPPPPLYRRAARLLLLLLLLPLLPLLFPLLLLASATALLAMALFRPALLRGLPRDVRFVGRLVAATRQLNRRLTRTSGAFTLADYWEETVSAHAHRLAIVFGEATYTYEEVDRASDRIAHWGFQRGLRPADGVALLCHNRPEYIFAWLAMAKLGISTALINPSLRGASLEHAVRQCDARLLLFDAASTPAVASALHALKGCDLICLDAAAHEVGAPMLSPPDAPPPPLAPLRSGCRSTDAALHIFTSGTTGLPKAAKVNHIRFFSAIVLPYMLQMTPEDRLYCCLPLCHTAAVGAVSMCWWLGAPLILAPKFSASTFWRDCHTHRVTIIQYVGELCRYLLHSPPSPYDRDHAVRMAFGNGLRPDVWPKFKARFNLELIAELYASTEGNANLVNTEGKEGAVGFISPLLAPLYPVKLVRVVHTDDGEQQLLRAPNGRCVPCRPGEAGELLGLVNQRDASRNFAGYTDRAATARKLAHGVVKRADCWFRSGDLLRTDEEGYVYFVDRMGDTFRYKGENVSTAEVGAVIGQVCGDSVQHALVYGVQLEDVEVVPVHERCALHTVSSTDGGKLPGVDGRVGMAALSLRAEGPPVDFSAMFERLEAELPAYAAPRFLRLLSPTDEIEMTITFKPRKEALVASGVSAGAAGAVYIRDADARTYVPLTPEVQEEIAAGTRNLG